MFGKKKNIKETLKRNKRAIKGIIENLDILIITFGVIMIWRGIWNFLDHYFFPSEGLFFLSNLGSIVLGVLIIYLHNFNLEKLGK